MVAIAAPALAQKHYEVQGFGGFTFGGGLSGDAVVTPSGTFDAVTVKSGPSFGASFGVILENGGEIGFQWGHQISKLGISGTTTVDIGDMSIDHYHAYVAYNAMSRSAVRPYVSFGVGATDYGTVTYTGVNQPGEIAGSARFSFIVGAGIKAWSKSGNVAFRAGLQWMPTYITSGADGWWCGNYWGCYAQSNMKFSNQVELSGGVVFRFGGK
jgi:hypothetical protein